MRSSRKRLQETVLKRRGMQVGRYGHIEPKPVARDPEGKKTLVMILVEDRFGQPIEQLLDSRYKLSELAELLGVTEATISRWRKRLGLGRWSQ